MLLYSEVEAVSAAAFTTNRVKAAPILVNMENINKIMGMNITFVTSGKTDEEAYALLKEFGLPFKNAKKN